MTPAETTIAIVFYVAGMFLGGIVVQTLGHDMTIEELKRSTCAENTPVNTADTEEKT
jgi:hypothetical protein